MQLLNNLSQENGGGLPYSEEAIHRTRTGYDWELYPDINWMDAITKDNGSNTRASLDISGGTERLRYSFILSYFGENGIIAKDKRREWSSDLTVRRYNVRTNVDYNLTQQPCSGSISADICKIAKALRAQSTICLARPL